MERGRRTTETGGNAVFPLFLREPIQHQPSLRHARETSASCVTRGRPTQSRDAGGRAPSALTVSNKDNPKAMCIYRFRLHTVERLVTHNSPLQQQRCIFPWFWPATQPPPRIARRPRSYAGQPAGRGNHLLAALTAAVEPRVGEVGLRKHRPRPPALAPSVCLRLRSGGTTLRCSGH
jgi:hypothetical protein